MSSFAHQPSQREIDIVVELGGKHFGIEVKSGNAVRSASQLAKDRLINAGLAAIFGRKAKANPLKDLTGEVLEAIWEARVP